MQSMLAMLGVTDMERSLAFYRDTLGLRVTFESPDWSTFDVGGTTLALHGGARPPAAESGSGGVQAGRATIGFGVEDVAETHRRLVERGARFVMPPTLREEEGILLAVLLDPDGLEISISQPVDRAEAAS